MTKPRDNTGLRVVEEPESPSEEVLRLKQEGGGEPVKAEPVAKLALPPAPEAPTRLGTGEVPEERRSHEPGIDAIIDGRDDSPDPEEQWHPDRQPVPYGWFVLIAIAVALAVVAATLGGRKDQPSAAEITREAVAERVAGDEVEIREARTLVETVERTITAYLEAEGVEALLPLVRHPERVRPLLEEWYAKHDFEPRKFRKMLVFEPINLGNHSFWRTMVAVATPGGGEEELEPILVEQLGDGSVRVDWETSVCYQPMAWDDYVRKRPEGLPLDFRVICQPDRAGLYSHEFRDEKIWRGIELTARDSEGYAIGYLRRGSELEARLYRLFVENRGRPLALVLRLSRPAGTRSPRGVFIEEIVSPHWLILDEH